MKKQQNNLLDSARAVMIHALDALESDADITMRIEAFEMIQQEFEGVSKKDHNRAKALIPLLRLNISDGRAGDSRAELKEFSKK